MGNEAVQFVLLEMISISEPAEAGEQTPLSRSEKPSLHVSHFSEEEHCAQLGRFRPQGLQKVVLAFIPTSVSYL